MILPILLYGSDNWTSTKSQASRFQEDEMRFLRYAAGYTLQDRKRNVDVQQEVHIMSILDRIA